jgi:hypothetical protein
MLVDAMIAINRNWKIRYTVFTPQSKTVECRISGLIISFQHHYQTPKSKYKPTDIPSGLRFLMTSPAFRKFEVVLSRWIAFARHQELVLGVRWTSSPSETPLTDGLGDPSFNQREPSLNQRQSTRE